MKNLKVSWSILNAWSSGRRDEAMKMLAGIETIQTPAMKRGSKLHDYIASRKLKLIPEISDKAIFEDIQPEKSIWTNYFRVDLTDWLKLSMVVDVYDPENKLIIDWKSGSRRSTEHNKMQIYLYALGTEIATGTKIERGIYGAIKEFDGGVICNDYSIFKINDEKLELARNYAETIASEIYSFINKEE